MNSNGFKQIQLNWSGVGCWLSAIAVVWLLGALGLGWIVKSVVVLIFLLLLAPIVAFIGFRWWLQRNLVEGDCPVCGFHMTGLRGAQTPCLNCSTLLKVEQGQFKRATPDGTIDVDAVEVEVVAETIEQLPPQQTSDGQ
ncbi:MAG: hypothetical protein AAF215_32125 [Cyanobacteria bacterium P01_A01_bin.123]